MLMLKVWERQKVRRGFAAAGVLVGMLFGTVPANAEKFGFGSTPTKAEIAAIDIDVMPDGRGLPSGSGTAKRGKVVYESTCAACHGMNLQGVGITGGAALIGGRGSIGTPKTKKTVESYWPYATTLFDYVKRAMPFNEPGSMKNDDIYAVSAYILSRAKIIKKTDVMSAKTLAKVKMPNRDGFIADPRPDVHNYR
jgi:cytochrome c